MKISWMKLDVNILSNEKIKLIRKYPDGDSLFVLWVAILCLAMKSRMPGVLMIADGAPYTAEDLSVATDLPVKTVQLGLELFARYGMITFDKFDTINITNMDNHQSFDKIAKQRELNYERVKRHRNKENMLKLESKEVPMITHYTVTSNATDIDIDIDNNIASENGVPLSSPSSPIGKEDMSKTNKRAYTEENKDNRSIPPADGKALLSHFYTEYKRVYGRDNEYKAVKADYIQAARIAKTYGEKSMAALTEYMNDGWAKDNGGHMFLSFVKNISRWINAIPKEQKSKNVENFVMG